MSKKRSINLLSSPISAKCQAQCSPSSSTPIRRDSGESYRSTSDSNIDNDKTDWPLCFLCQKETSEILQCSTLSKTDAKQLYVADRIKEFHSIKMLPIALNIKLEDGLDLEQSLFTNSAKFYKGRKLKLTPLTQQNWKKHIKNPAQILQKLTQKPVEKKDLQVLFAGLIITIKPV